jgi:hypothetical protein
LKYLFGAIRLLQLELFYSLFFSIILNFSGYGFSKRFLVLIPLPNLPIKKSKSMKKITLLLLCSAFSLTVFSQTIPNAGFETWVTNTELAQSYMLPQHWISSDMFQNAFDSLYTGVSVTKSTQSYAGSFAVKMETVISHNDTVSGTILSADSFSQLIGSAFGDGTSSGFPDAVLSANLQAYYKFSSTGNDYAFIALTMTKWNTTTHMRDTLVDLEHDITSNALSYTLLNVPITYTISENPDTVFIASGISGPGSNGTSHVGTTFYLDAMSFTGTVPLGVDELKADNKYVKLYPNPFSNSTTISIDPAIKLNNTSIVITDVLGKEVKTMSNINNNQVTLEKGDMPTGIYFYKLINNDVETANGKFIVK